MNSLKSKTSVTPPLPSLSLSESRDLSFSMLGCHASSPLRSDSLDLCHAEQGFLGLWIEGLLLCLVCLIFIIISKYIDSLLVFCLSFYALYMSFSSILDFVLLFWLIKSGENWWIWLYQMFLMKSSLDFYKIFFHKIFCLYRSYVNYVLFIYLFFLFLCEIFVDLYLLWHLIKV